jgi:Protein of unknown function (DUF3575)
LITVFNEKRKLTSKNDAMYKRIVLSAMFFYSSWMIAQTSVYRMDFFRAVQGTIQLAKELKISRCSSLSLAGMGTFASTRGLAKPYLKAQEFNYIEPTSNLKYNLNDVEVKGFGINLQFRRYHDSTFSGWYIAPELFYRKLFLSSEVSTSTQNNIDVTRQLHLAYIGYSLGYQKIFRDAIVIDAALGGGFFYSHYQNEKSFTKYRNNYQIDFTGFYLNASFSVGLSK